jgi:hypothetical protein
MGMLSCHDPQARSRYLPAPAACDRHRSPGSGTGLKTQAKLSESGRHVRNGYLVRRLGSLPFGAVLPGEVH